jgi:hypothetical protein
LSLLGLGLLRRRLSLLGLLRCRGFGLLGCLRLTLGLGLTVSLRLPLCLGGLLCPLLGGLLRSEARRLDRPGPRSRNHLLMLLKEVRCRGV